MAELDHIFCQFGLPFTNFETFLNEKMIVRTNFQATVKSTIDLFCFDSRTVLIPKTLRPPIPVRIYAARQGCPSSETGC